MCTPCPAGYSCTNTADPVECDSGKYSLTGEMTCTSCPAGKYCAITTSVFLVFTCVSYKFLFALSNNCPSNNLPKFNLPHVPHSRTAPTVCAAGYYSAAGATSCTECAAGSYCTSKVQTACDNKKWSEAGYTSCVACEAGRCCPVCLFDCLFICLNCAHLNIQGLFQSLN